MKYLVETFCSKSMCRLIITISDRTRSRSIIPKFYSTSMFQPHKELDLPFKNLLKRVCSLATFYVDYTDIGIVVDNYCQIDTSIISFSDPVF